MARKSFWNSCLEQLESELSVDQFNTWIRPLQAEKDRNRLTILAPNRFVKEWVEDNHLERISEVVSQVGEGEFSIILKIGTRSATPNAQDDNDSGPVAAQDKKRPAQDNQPTRIKTKLRWNDNFRVTFNTFQQFLEVYSCKFSHDAFLNL